MSDKQISLSEWLLVPFLIVLIVIGYTLPLAIQRGLPDEYIVEKVGLIISAWVVTQQIWASLSTMLKVRFGPLMQFSVFIITMSITITQQAVGGSVIPPVYQAQALGFVLAMATLDHMYDLIAGGERLGHKLADMTGWKSKIAAAEKRKRDFDRLTDTPRTEQRLHDIEELARYTHE